MLEDSLLESRKKKPRNPVTVVVSAVAHVVTVGVLVLIPLLRIEALSVPPVDMSMWVPHFKVIDLTPAPSVHRPTTQHTETTPAGAFISPVDIPQKIAIVDEPPVSIPGFIPSGPGGEPGTALMNLIGRAGPDVGPPPKPPAPAEPPPAPPVIKIERIRQSTGAQAAKLIYQVKPVYPQIAIRTRIQGTVVLEAVITKEGTIDSLQVISGHPFLNQAAIDAVKQWRYRPTTLSGEPVSVITNVTVTFTLQ